jgi:hypothetical protein
VCRSPRWRQLPHVRVAGVSVSLRVSIDGSCWVSRSRACDVVG